MGLMNEEQLLELADRDPVEFARVYASLEAGEQPAADAQPPEATATSQEAPAPEPQQQPPGNQDDTAAAASSSGTEATQPATAKPAGVLTRDGKEVIPYTVLERERERAAEAQRLAREAQAEAEKARQELERLRAGGQANPATQRAASDRIAALNERVEALGDLPELRNLFTSVFEVLNEQQTEIASYRDRETRREQEQRARAESDARAKAAAAMDANPYLSLWNSAPDTNTAAVAAFDRAAEHDQFLRNDPYWQRKSIDERFNEAVRRTLEEMPDAPKPAAASSAPPAQSDANALLRSAEQAFRNAQAKGPRTLSDLPGGAPPAANPFETLGNADVVQIAAMYEQMGPDKFLEHVARLSA